MPFVATWMDLEIVILSEKQVRETQIFIGYHLYVVSKNTDINQLIYKTKTDLKE